MPMPVRLGVVILLGAILTGAEAVGPRASAVAPGRSVSYPAAAFAPQWSGLAPDEDEAEETSCPDWRVRR